MLAKGVWPFRKLFAGTGLINQVSPLSSKWRLEESLLISSESEDFNTTQTWVGIFSVLSSTCCGCRLAKQEEDGESF